MECLSDYCNLEIISCVLNFLILVSNSLSMGMACYGLSLNENVIENVTSERPVHSDIGKHKPREPSDALDAQVCSDIAQGRVKCNPHLVVFYVFLVCGGTIKGGGDSLGRRYC